MARKNKVQKEARALLDKFRTEKRPSYTARERFEQARQYADADRSDPFAMMRAVNHMKNGICSFTPDGKDGFYQAEVEYEDREIQRANGSWLRWKAPIYKNRARP